MHNSFINWPGAKHNALKKIFRHVPRKGSLFVDVFAGSGAVALNTSYDNYIINDLNKDLINLYKLTVAQPDETLAQALKLFTPETNTKTAYLGLRNEFNEEDCPDRRAILFLYLIRHSFNALVRFSKQGNFNVPFGDRKKPSVNAGDFMYFAEKFEDATFTCMNFKELLSKHHSNATIYNDPPYLPLPGKDSFVDYTAEGFDTSLHTALDSLSSLQRGRGNRVFTSNHALKDIRTHYPLASRQANFFVKRKIASKKEHRKNIRETVLIYE